MNTELSIAVNGQGLYEITSNVAAVVATSGFTDGLATVYIRHTSASLVIQENADPAVQRDLEAFLARVVPEEPSAGEREGAPLASKEPSAGEREGAPLASKEPSAGEREGAPLASKEPSAGEREGAPLAAKGDYTPVRYTHVEEGPDDMPAHIKSALTQTHLSIPVMDGRLALGTWQGVFLWEHRHRRNERRIIVNLLS